MDDELRESCSVLVLGAFGIVESVEPETDEPVPEVQAVPTPKKTRTMYGDL